MKTVIRDIFLKQMLNIQNLHNLHSDLPFLQERKKITKYNNLVCDFHDKKNYAVHIKALKQVLILGLLLFRTNTKKSAQSNSI